MGSKWMGGTRRRRSEPLKIEWLKQAIRDHRAQYGHLPAAEQPCLMWPWAKTGKGYGRVFDGFRMRPSHRLAYELFVKAVPDGLDACHSCDTPGCINPAHLFPGTRSENMRDCAAKGRNTAQIHPELHARGERNGMVLHPECRPSGIRNGNAKLTEDAVREIRAKAQGGVSYSAIGREFGISNVLAGLIAKRRRWVHVQ